MLWKKSFFDYGLISLLIIIVFYEVKHLAQQFHWFFLDLVLFVVFFKELFFFFAFNYYFLSGFLFLSSLFSPLPNQKPDISIKLINLIIDVLIR